MFKTSLWIILLSMAVMGAACGKKVSQIQDPGPVFHARAPGLKLQLDASSTIMVKRNEESSGPQITLQGLDENNVDTVERSLACGTQTLPGKTARREDLDLTNFRISQEEFPGLARLPMNSDCKLTVKATNQYHSTYSVTLPLTLRFDVPPQIDISRHVAEPGLNPMNSRFEIQLETYVIKNTLPYAIGFTFIPRRTGRAIPHFQIQRVGQPPSPYSTWDRYEKKLMALTPTRIEISGDVLTQTGDMVHGLNFSMPAHGQVSLTAFASARQDLTADMVTSCRTFTPFGTDVACERTLIGIYVLDVHDAPSLARWHSFQATEDDKTHPLLMKFPKELPIPGITVDNSLPINFYKE